MGQVASSSRLVSCQLSEVVSRASCNGKTSIFDGTREAVVYSGTMVYPSTNMWIRTAPIASPQDGVGWTTTRVNDLVARVGYSTDTTPRPWWDAPDARIRCGARTATAAVTVR